jgi:hypothetical protein
MNHIKKILLATIVILIPSNHLNAGPRKKELQATYRSLEVDPHIMFKQIQDRIMNFNKNKCLQENRFWGDIILTGIPELLKDRVPKGLLQAHIDILKGQLLDHHGDAKSLSAEEQLEYIYNRIDWLISDVTRTL